MTAPDPVALRHMRRALRLACDSVAAGGGPFGAVIARGEEVVAEGGNRVTLDLDPTAHAEVTAIRRACRALGRFELRGLVLYSSCEPCPMCLAAIHWARLDGAHFAGTRQDAAAAGFDDELLYREVALPIALRTVPTHPLLPEEGGAPFAAWAAKADRTAY
ncbi:nucleoside deaminase [Roseicella aquatilis]|uniref:Nucleoside deaminase n=1 Tax=Roseicella aquatilis TaxID=2527868 RepID=A0A4R4D4C7_9PROT|nr:nucleoside deaminase [Roseicella aquatilis]TCZ55119.1 nucleoside deaminase [Roseicella aquatilis]